MKKKLPENIRFEGWDWGDFDETVGELFDALNERLTAAIAKDMARVIDEQAAEDGVDVTLQQCMDDGTPEIGVAFDFLTHKGAAVDDIDSAHVEFSLPGLLDEMISFDPWGAVDLLPAFRAMVGKLEALEKTGPPQ